MNKHKYFVVDKKWFDALLCGSRRVFLEQTHFEQDFVLVVESHKQETGQLFILLLEIITQPLSPLAHKAVQEICEKYGYRVIAIDNKTQQGKYLGSDGGGHYSTDFYEMIKYASITITAK